ncbi:hypothetical protein N0V94_008064 [Neodidymelliopsis sp. IMI 364377]|nr:hypothetical protein N0V94_008064 [Neodidymelliopsis sp. IMI 364377]
MRIESTAQQPQSSAATISRQPAGQRMFNKSSHSVEFQARFQQAGHVATASPGWSAIQQDFEQRLSRFGIKVSDANNNQPSRSHDPTIAEIRGVPRTLPRSGAHAVMDRYRNEAMAGHAIDSEATAEVFPSHGVSFVASAKVKEETENASIDRQLQHARTEAQVWKQRYEAGERDLCAAYRETMEWRMKYEDLYSAVVQGRESSSQKFQGKRQHTQSLS